MKLEASIYTRIYIYTRIFEFEKKRHRDRTRENEGEEEYNYIDVSYTSKLIQSHVKRVSTGERERE